MKYLEEYRDEDAVRGILDELRRITTHPWTIMEICGGQTHSIIRHGLDQLLPQAITLVHGPGCPVCVTPLALIDKAIALASQPDVILASFGDMLRVPGSEQDLFAVKAQGGDVRVVYSPLDALEFARQNPDKTVVFFGVGFETTAPANAMAIFQAAQSGVDNFCMLVSHVTVPPAMVAILESRDNQVQAFLAAGHVCTVMGYWEYEPLAQKYHVPIVVTGFEPLDLARGILLAVRQLENGHAQVENAYERSVRREGNQSAQRIIKEIFEPCDRAWRGIGVIPMSGYRLRAPYTRFDAETRFADIALVDSHESDLCISGMILQGVKKPKDCAAFGKECTPRTPLGATMVSSEGACAAYYRYGRINDPL